MKEIKIKLKESDKAIKLLFVQNKQTIGTETKYINKCIICKKTTVDELNFGEKHICPECLETIKKDFRANSKPKKKTVRKKVETTNQEEKAESEKETKQTREISVFARTYKPSISLINYIKYKDLMLRPLREDIVTMLVDFILKGVNTAEKITNAIKFRRTETIYVYLTMLAKVGMLCPVGTLNKKTRLTRLYRVNSTLEYVNI